MYLFVCIMATSLWFFASAKDTELENLKWRVNLPVKSSANRLAIEPQAIQPDRDGRYHSMIVSRDVSPHVHAASALPTTDGGILAFWYGGSREGAKDVKIFQARWHHGLKSWSEPEEIMGPRALSFALRRYVKKVGNPLAIRVANGDIWLTFVSVSIGGWAGSQLNWISSSDDGLTWSAPKRWVTSPFFNVSTLVKSPGQLYLNHWVGIPIYHEFIGKFAEYLILDSDGRIQHKARMDWGRDNLQPLVLPLSEDSAASYLRFAGGAPNQLLYTRSDDAGVSWQPSEPIALPNPNASVAGVGLSSQEQILVFNNSKIDRRVLSLGYSSDQGKHWETIHDFENAQDDVGEFSYPVLINDGDLFHLFYTWNRKHIKHLYFDQAWLTKKITSQRLGVSFEKIAD